jgi:hypothetical protein
MAEWSDQKLLTLLRTDGPQTPASLMARLGTSQSTLLRSAKAQRETIVALGARINRKLAASRKIRGLGFEIPVFQVLPSGEVSQLGRLLALYPTMFAFVLESAPNKPQIYPGLPFFLDDMRPQGFLGRAFGQKHSDLNLPTRILDWSHDDIAEALALRGEDLVGNLLIGAESFKRIQKLRSEIEVIDEKKIKSQYIKHAQSAVDGQPAGSSAGGEQPKFGAVVSGTDGKAKRVLVKFSPSGDSFSAERWRDLLICESLSLEVLREHSIATAEGRIIESGGRTFLETVRFDRAGLHGRKGMLSLAALENEWISQGENWAVSATRLQSEKKISADDLRTIQILECFGRLIANSDRHSGNLSFFWSPEEKTARLTPVYDMLPMLYAPSSGGEDTGKTFTLPTYEYTLLNAWKTALPIAIQYWQRIREDSRLSVQFKDIAGKNLKVLNQAEK